MDAHGEISIREKYYWLKESSDLQPTGTNEHCDALLLKGRQSPWTHQYLKGLHDLPGAGAVGALPLARRLFPQEMEVLREVTSLI